MRDGDSRRSCVTELSVDERERKNETDVDVSEDAESAVSVCSEREREWGGASWNERGRDMMLRKRAPRSLATIRPSTTPNQ